MKKTKVYYIGVVTPTEGGNDINLLGEGKRPLAFASRAKALGVLTYLQTLSWSEFNNFRVFSAHVTEQ